MLTIHANRIRLVRMAPGLRTRGGVQHDAWGRTCILTRVRNEEIPPPKDVKNAGRSGLVIENKGSRLEGPDELLKTNRISQITG